MGCRHFQAESRLKPPQAPSSHGLLDLFLHPNGGCYPTCRRAPATRVAHLSFCSFISALLPFSRGLFLSTSLVAAALTEGLSCPPAGFDHCIQQVRCLSISQTLTFLILPSSVFTLPSRPCAHAHLRRRASKQQNSFVLLRSSRSPPVAFDSVLTASYPHGGFIPPEHFLPT